MKKLLIIKYAELNTKKGNIDMFIKTLYKNLKLRLEGIDCEIKYDQGRMFVTVDETYYHKCIDIISNTFGIHEVEIGYELDNNDLEVMKDSIIKVTKDMQFNTFKVETRRGFKKYPLTSLEVSRILGGVVLKNKENVKVDVHNPEVIIHVEIRDNKSYIYALSYPCVGGYPFGVAGKGLLMLSGGIDSPVAGYLAMKRGVKLECIYFDSPPHTSDEARNKVINLASILASYAGMPIKVHVIPFTKIQEEIYKNIPNEYLITIMRRMMYRISAKIAHRNRCKVLVNGESIGQVASQTLDSMSVINETIKMPVIRPVACFDKLDIIDIAKKIKTYETSILPFQDCCTIFVPEHPIINPDLETCYEYEKLIPNYEELILEAIKNHKVVYTDKYNQEKNSEFEDLL